MQTVGWVGAAVLLLGYLQVSRGRLPGDGVGFQAASVAGSVGLGLAAVDGRVWSAVVVNSLWGSIAVAALVRVGLKHLRPDGSGTGTTAADTSRD